MNPENIYHGNRSLQFKEFIFGLLKKGKLKSKYINVLLKKENLDLFSSAFTAASADPEDNYEIFEQLGDLSANKFIVWYMYKRFPFLKTPRGVKVVARLRINYGAKNSFSDIAEKLGFWPFISCATDGTTNGMKYKNRHKKDLLEDVFEAFIGCTEFILDNELRVGVGYGIVYQILSSIFDEMDISLNYNDLFDAKTRLKEVFDCYPDQGTWNFTNRRQDIDDDGHSVSVSSLYIVPQGTNKLSIKKSTGPNKNDFIEIPQNGWILIAEASASTKSASQQKAASIGITILNKQGFVKEIPPEYKFFQESQKNQSNQSK